MKFVEYIKEKKIDQIGNSIYTEELDNQSGISMIEDDSASCKIIENNAKNCPQ